MHPVLAALRASAEIGTGDGSETYVFKAQMIRCIDAAQDILDKGIGADTNFESFWQLYPRKVGKPAACRAWVKMDGDKHWGAIHRNISIRLHTKQWERTPERIQYIPHPTTYLNQRRWLDEGAPVESVWGDV